MSSVTVACLLDGDPDNPHDTIARKDLELAQRLRDRFIPQAKFLLMQGLRTESDPVARNSQANPRQRTSAKSVSNSVPCGSRLYHSEMQVLSSLSPRSLILAGGSVAGSLAALSFQERERTHCAKFILSLHTPGSPAKHLLPEVAHSYRTPLSLPAGRAGECTSPRSLIRMSESSRKKYLDVAKALTRCDILCTNSKWTASVLCRTYGYIYSDNGARRHAALGSSALRGEVPDAEALQRELAVVAESVGVDVPVNVRYDREPHRGRPRLVSIMRDSQRKRPEGLWAAMRWLLRNTDLRPEWHVLCGPDRAGLQANCQDTPGFVFHDFMDERSKFALIARAHLLVHPAYCEHLGLGILEACLVETPILISRSGGPPTYLSDKEANFFDPDNWRDMAWQIHHALSDPIESERRAARAKRTIVERFSWNAVLNRFTAYFH